MLEHLPDPSTKGYPKRGLPKAASFDGGGRKFLMENALLVRAGRRALNDVKSQGVTHMLNKTRPFMEAAEDVAWKVFFSFEWGVVL